MTTETSLIIGLIFSWVAWFLIGYFVGKSKGKASNDKG